MYASGVGIPDVAQGGIMPAPESVPKGPRVTATPTVIEALTAVRTTAYSAEAAVSTALGGGGHF